MYLKFPWRRKPWKTFNSSCDAVNARFPSAAVHPHALVMRGSLLLTTKNPFCYWAEFQAEMTYPWLCIYFQVVSHYASRIYIPLNVNFKTLITRLAPSIVPKPGLSLAMWKSASIKSIIVTPLQCPRQGPTCVATDCRSNEIKESYDCSSLMSLCGCTILDQQLHHVSVKS